MSFDEILKVVLFSIAPVFEQRMGIPLAILKYDWNPAAAMVVSYIASILPSPFILLLFNVILKEMKKYKFLTPLNDFIDKKVQKGSVKVKKYEKLGLILFVAIPLPTTGVWTGSAVAAFLGLDYKKSLLCILLGASISAVIITLLCVFLPSAAEFLGIIK